MEKIYQLVTDRIINLLEQGTVPWHKPWGGFESLPKSLVSGKAYRGINSFLLHAASYESPYWLTFKQAKERGGTVTKGEKGFPCIYWNWVERLDKETGEKKKIPFLRYYTVFNVAQCAGVAYPAINIQENVCDPIPACEAIVTNMPNPPTIEEEGFKATYSSSADTVTMPRATLFDSSEDYYSTLFHELVHSTGHKNRLNRQSLNETAKFGSSTYSLEELVAEMGSAFLCGVAGL